MCRAPMATQPPGPLLTVGVLGMATLESCAADWAQGLGLLPPMGPFPFSSSFTLSGHRRPGAALTSQATPGKRKAHTPSYRDPRKLQEFLPTRTGGRQGGERWPPCASMTGVPNPAQPYASALPVHFPRPVYCYFYCYEDILQLHMKEKTNPCTYY